MRAILLSSLALLLLGSAGCGAEGPPTRAEGEAVAPPAEDRAEPAPSSGEGQGDAEGEEPQAAGSCEAIAARFRTAMSAATGRCESDADCMCFNPVVSEAGCGGITDRPTATRLATIESDFHTAGCPWPHQCGPWACRPACQEGHCVGASGGMALPAPLPATP
jgi:hypothetical protein